MSDHQSGGRQWELGSRMHHGSGVGISSLKLTLIEVKREEGMCRDRRPKMAHQAKARSIGYGRHGSGTKYMHRSLALALPPSRRVDLEGFIVVGGEANKDCEVSRRVLKQLECGAKIC